jgi:aerobic-type carbon monoxide dehydrogenase small subunit (CoxS/CutS family)
MPGTQLQLSPLQARKQLLIIESEVNREQLRADLETLHAKVDDAVAQCHAVVAHVNGFMSGFNSIRSFWSETQNEEGGWVAKIGSIFRAGFSLWKNFKSRGS